MMEDDIMRKLVDEPPLLINRFAEVEPIWVVMWGGKPHSSYSCPQVAQEALDALEKRYRKSFKAIPPPLSSVHEIESYRLHGREM
jgi:hypothetical protein